MLLQIVTKPLVKPAGYHWNTLGEHTISTGLASVRKIELERTFVQCTCVHASPKRSIRRRQSVARIKGKYLLTLSSLVLHQFEF